MARPDPALLDPRRFRHRTEIATRYVDLDPNQHVNNIAIAAMFQDGRIRFMRDSLAFELDDAGVMVANFTIDYVGETFYPAPVEVHSAVTRIGRTSVEVLQLAAQDGRPVALASTVMVLTRGAKPIPVPPEWTDTLSRISLLP